MCIRDRPIWRLSSESSKRCLKRDHRHMMPPAVDRRQRTWRAPRYHNFTAQAHSSVVHTVVCRRQRWASNAVDVAVLRPMVYVPNLFATLQRHAATEQLDALNTQPHLSGCEHGGACRAKCAAASDARATRLKQLKLPPARCVHTAICRRCRRLRAGKLSLIHI